MSLNESLAIAFLSLVSFVFICVIFLKIKNKIQLKLILKNNFPHWILYPQINYNDFLKAIEITETQAEKIISNNKKFVLYPEREYNAIGSDIYFYLVVEINNVWNWYKFKTTTTIESSLKDNTGRIKINTEII